MAAALAPAYAIAILLAGGPDDGCPSPRQLADALSAHLPGMVLPLGHATGPMTLRLAVTTDAAGAMRLDLSDPEGGPLLHRWLPANEHSHAGDCPALAETAALIVDRYWHEVGYDVAIEAPPAPPKPPPKATPPPASKPAEPPPSPPPAPAIVKTHAPPTEPPAETLRPAEPQPPAEPLPPPRWWVGVGGGGLVTETGSHAASALVAIAVERPVFKRRVGLRLSAGMETGVSASFTYGSADIWQFPVRMGGYLPIAIRRRAARARDWARPGRRLCRLHPPNTLCHHLRDAPQRQPGHRRRARLGAADATRPLSSGFVAGCDVHPLSRRNYL